MALIKISRTTKRESKMCLLVIIFTILSAMFGSFWRSLKYERIISQMDLTPGSVGSEADNSIPIVTTLDEIKANNRFALQLHQSYKEYDNSDDKGGTLGGKYYRKLKLEDGTEGMIESVADAEWLTFREG